MFLRVIIGIFQNHSAVDVLTIYLGFPLSNAEPSAYVNIHVDWISMEDNGFMRKVTRICVLLKCISTAYSKGKGNSKSRNFRER